MIHYSYIERDVVSIHRRLDCLLNRLFMCTLRIISKLRVSGLFEENSPVTGEFSVSRARNTENGSMCWRQRPGFQWVWNRIYVEYHDGKSNAPLNTISGYVISCYSKIRLVYFFCLPLMLLLLHTQEAHWDQVTLREHRQDMCISVDKGAIWISDSKVKVTQSATGGRWWCISLCFAS